MTKHETVSKTIGQAEITAITAHLDPEDVERLLGEGVIVRKEDGRLYFTGKAVEWLIAFINDTNTKLESIQDASGNYLYGGDE